CSYWELGDDPKEVITGNCDADVETMESLYVKSGRGFTYFHGYPGEYGSRSFGQIVTDGLKLTHSEIDEVRSSRYGEVSAAVIKTYACTKRPPK
ncbi:MAG: hypothetical protein VXW22_15560, partial [Pseudomonadota bacterium]|nr:hypothetical protein [Pseudomonadota bacterium]